MHTVVNQVDQFDHQTVLSSRTVDRWWGCSVYYRVLYLASRILHISMIYLILIACCMCCSSYWCSLCGTHSDNRHSGFLHDHLELLYHRQNSQSWHVGLVLGDNRQNSLSDKCTQIYQIVFFSCVYKYAWVDKFYFCWRWEIEGLHLFDVNWLFDHMLIVNYFWSGVSQEKRKEASPIL